MIITAITKIITIQNLFVERNPLYSVGARKYHLSSFLFIFYYFSLLFFLLILFFIFTIYFIYSHYTYNSGRSRDRMNEVALTPLI